MTETTNAMMELAEQLAPVLDLVDGHREETRRRGYSDAAAEAMAVTLHGALIATIFRGVTPPVSA